MSSVPQNLFFPKVNYNSEQSYSRQDPQVLGRLKYNNNNNITSLARSRSTGAAPFFPTSFRYLDKTKPSGNAVARKGQHRLVSIPCGHVSPGQMPHSPLQYATVTGRLPWGRDNKTTYLQTTGYSQKLGAESMNILVSPVFISQHVKGTQR